jgi:hypothetical protein
MQQRCHHASASARSPSWQPMPRPRLQRAATARREKVQLRIREQSSVHKNTELVPDSAGIRMYVRTTRQVPKDSEILVMYQPDRGFFGGVHGRCKCCLCEKSTPECCAQGFDVFRGWAQWGAGGAPVFEGSNKLVLIMFTSVTCMLVSVTCILISVTYMLAFL